MIISKKYKFIFVKTVKTASTSVEVFLSRHCGPFDILTPIEPHVKPHVPRNFEGFFNHIEAYRIREKVGKDIWNSYFKFCVERNPWDKTLSYYYMKKAREDSSLSFDSYVRGNELPVNYQKYTEPDRAGEIIVDRVIYFEQLNYELAKVFRDLGIPFSGSLGVNAKAEYRTDRRPYQEVYTSAQASRIADVFQQELALHGYRF